MVSTRQMSNVGGGSGANDNACISQSGESSSYSRITRHSAAGSVSPHQNVSTNCVSIPRGTANLIPQKIFNTNLMDLPVELLEKILHFVGYKNVSSLRMVNRQFNTVCSSVLNSTFQRLQNQMWHRFHEIKSKMPRRESARRSHPLACESDIIETLHMRLTLLQMTFGKHIERRHCCFFPGEILDEVYGILTYLKTATKLARPYKVTDELFDLTTMAMEYFKEHIEPNLPEITYFGTDFFDIANPFSPGESNKSYMCIDSPPAGEGGAGSSNAVGTAPDSSRRQGSHSYLDESLPPSPPPPQSNMVLRKRIHRIKQGMKKYNDQLSALKSDLKSCKRKTALQQKQIAEQQKQIAEQQKQTMEYANRLDDYDKKNEETSRKFQTLLQELNKCKTELQYWRSRSPGVCGECGVTLPLYTPSNSFTTEGEASHSNQEIQDYSAEPTPEPVAVSTSTPAMTATTASTSVNKPSTQQQITALPKREADTNTESTPERKKRRLTRPRPRKL